MSPLIFFFLLCGTTVSSVDFSLLEHYCYVQSPKDFTIFDLTTLQSDNYDSSIRLSDLEHLRVHFCSPLKDPCNGKYDYAVCLHSNDKEVGIGRVPPKVAVESGKIMIRYSGDKCNNTHNYNVDFEIKCNFSMKAKIDEQLDIVYNRDECGFQMTIPTSAACSKAKQTTCDIKNESGYFNLKPLIELSSNYIIKLNQNLNVILNVCHSLIYGHHFSECDYDTMVCLVDKTNAARPSFTRLGNINNNVRISTSNGSVYLDLTSDTPCGREDDTGLKTIRTTIEFVCKVNATNTLPKYTSGFGTCHYKFTWVTAAACSEDTLIQQSEVNHQPCTIKDPIYDQLFDLSMLEGSVTSVNSSDNTAEYEFSVCSPLQKSNCTKEGTGVCKYIKEKNIGLSKGQANTELMWRGDRLLLNYTDGTACGNYQRGYTTIIFECSKDNYVTVKEEDPCATIIVWKSSKICNHGCATPDHEFDFNKLRGRVLNYFVPGDNPGTNFYMNVCGPLLDDGFTNCSYGTGVCKVVTDVNGTRIGEINLGFAEPGLRTAPDGRLYLNHVNGSICEEDPSKRISSEISFTCDLDAAAVGHLFFLIGEAILTSGRTLGNFYNLQEIGIKSFEGYSNCKYHFNFKSRYVCPKDIDYFTEDCLDENHIKNFDLSLFLENYRFHINANESTGYFNGSACGDLSKCHGTLICDNWYGHKMNPTPKKDRLAKLVVFKFENKTECKNESFINAWINVWCATHEGSAESFFVKDEECSLGINWDDTVSVCEIQNNSTGGLLKTILIIVSLIILALILVALYFYRNKDKRQRCFDSVNNFVARYTSYASVRGEAEEAVVNNVANDTDNNDTADEDGDIAMH